MLLRLWFHHAVGDAVGNDNPQGYYNSHGNIHYCNCDSRCTLEEFSSPKPQFQQITLEDFKKSGIEESNKYKTILLIISKECILLELLSIKCLLPLSLLLSVQKMRTG